MAKKVATPELVDKRPTIHSQRLILRPFSNDDEAAVVRICSHREIAANTRSIPHPYPPEQALEWIGTHREMWLNGQAVVFAICQRQSTDADNPPGPAIGAIGLEIDEANQIAEMGYWIDREFWGQGVCTEAARRVLQFGFEELALHRIHANHITTNPASGRVLEKIGMHRDGLFRGHIRKWGKFYDLACFGILKSEFPAVKATWEYVPQR